MSTMEADGQAGRDPCRAWTCEGRVRDREGSMGKRGKGGSGAGGEA